MSTDSKTSPLAFQQDADRVLVSGRWSRMIPTILELGSQDSGGQIDPAELHELFAMGMIDAPDDDRHPALSTFGLAVYKYLTRF